MTVAKQEKPPKPLIPWRATFFLKAGDRTRTGDPQLGKLMLYQLSYAREAVNVAERFRRKKTGRPHGTPGLSFLAGTDR